MPRPSALPARLLRRAAVAVARTGVLAGRSRRVLDAREGHAAYWAGRAREAAPLTLVALGDSLTVGIGAADPADGFVGLLAHDLAAERGCAVRVVNLGVSGTTLDALLAEQLPAARAELAGAALVTVCIGTNDAARTPPDRFAAAFATLLDALPDGALVSDLPSFQGGHAAAEATALGQVCRDALAARPRLRAVALEAATAGMAPWEFSADLAHPGARGYRRYAAAFRAARGSGGWRGSGGSTAEPPTRRRP